MKNLLLVLTFSLAAAGWRGPAGSRALADPPNAPEPLRLETPTDDDRRMLATFNAIVAQVDKPGTPARELADNSRLPWIAPMVKSLGSAQPVNVETLKAARAFVQTMMPQLQAAGLMKPPPLGVIARRQGAVKIDGHMNEPDWQRAAPMRINFDNLKHIPGPAATARLLWDEKYLYVGFNVPDANIIAPPVERDGPVWKYDCVEVFLLPEPRFGVYWELNVSPTGSLLDNLLYKYQMQWGDDGRSEESLEGLQIGRSVRGTANLETDVDQGYTVELAIPWNQLPGTARGASAGARIHLMLARVNRDSSATDAPIAYLGHVPYVGWLHNIWAYQEFALGK